MITINTKSYKRAGLMVALIATLILFSPMYGRAESKENNKQTNKYEKVDISVTKTSSAKLIPKDVIQAALKASEIFDIEPQYILGMLCVENGQFNPKLINYNSNGTYDIGYAQINSSNLKDFKASGFKDIYNIDDNIQYGTLKLKYAKDVYGDDWHKIYMVYNMGGRKAKELFNSGINYTSYSKKVMGYVSDMARYFDEQVKKDWEYDQTKNEHYYINPLFLQNEETSDPLFDGYYIPVDKNITISETLDNIHFYIPSERSYYEYTRID